MTKVGRLYEEEKIEAVNKTRIEERLALAKRMLAKDYGLLDSPMTKHAREAAVYFYNVDI